MSNKKTTIENKELDRLKRRDKILSELEAVYEVDAEEWAKENGVKTK